MDSVNGGAAVLVDQPDTGGSHVILSVPVKLNLVNGANTIVFGANQTSKSYNSSFELTNVCHATDYAADLDKIIVYTAT